MNRPRARSHLIALAALAAWLATAAPAEAAPIQAGAVAVDGSLGLGSMSSGPLNADPTRGEWYGSVRIGARWFPVHWLACGAEASAMGLVLYPSDFGGGEVAIGPRLDLVLPLGDQVAAMLSGTLSLGHGWTDGRGGNTFGRRLGGGLLFFPAPEVSVDLRLSHLHQSQVSGFTPAGWQLGLSFTVYFGNEPPARRP